MQSLVTNGKNKTCLSHEFLDFLISFPFTHEQLVMVLAFLHRTYENHDDLTATIGFSREKSTQVLYELVELGIIELIGENWISLSGYRIPFSVKFHIK
jgi:hypothetical protein